MKKIIRNQYTDNLQEDLRSYMLPLYISRIASVRFIDTNVIIKLSLSAKNVYGYLTGLGYCCGYNSIYANITQISEHLAISVGTVNNSLKTLQDIGLIKIVHVKQKGKFDSNHYWVYRPNLLDRRQWLDLNGNVLRGVNYSFDYKQFQKSRSECRADKLLEGLILNKENKNNVDVRE